MQSVIVSRQTGVYGYWDVASEFAFRYWVLLGVAKNTTRQVGDPPVSRAPLPTMPHITSTLLGCDGK